MPRSPSIRTGPAGAAPAGARCAPPRSPPLRPGRRVAAVVLVAVAATAVLLWWLALPAFVAGRTRTALRDAGFAHVALEVDGIGLTSARLRDLRLGAAADAGGAGGTLEVDSVHVRFDPFELLGAGRLAEVVLQGPTWTLAAAPGRALAPFDALRRREDAAVPPTAAPPAAALPELPVGRLAIENGRIVSPDGELAVLHGSADLAPDRWTLRLDARLGDLPAELRGELAGAGVRASGPLSLRAGAAQPLELQGRLELEAHGRGRTATGSLAHAGPFALALPGGTWRGEGGLELVARVPFRSPADAAFAVRLEQLDLESPWGLHVAGLAADLSAAGLPLPATRAPQELRWTGARLGALTTLEGSAELGLEAGGTLVVHGARWAVDERGSMRLDELRVGPGTERFTTRLHLESVPLQQWLQLATRGRVTGEGRLDGSLGVAVTVQPRLDVDLQAGRLAAVGGGVVRLLEDESTEELVREHAGRVAATSEYGPVVEDRLIAALKEFRYRELAFRLDPGPEDDVTLHVRVAGQGVRVPQELVLDIDFRGFGQAIDLALAARAGLDRARGRLEAGIRGPPAGGREQEQPPTRDQTR